jgi:23S rRNA (cytosine1962-C5)-methyltransferase
VNEEKAMMFRNRLSKVFRHLGKQARRQKVTCFRVYDHDLPEFPFCIEIYEDKLYVAEYNRRHGMDDEQHQDWLEACVGIMTSVTGIPADHVFLKLRKRKPGRLGQYQKQDSLKTEFEVNEQGLKFLVNLGDYLDTGLFLDHRVTRQMVREGSRDKKVLNLFAYTGTFSVYAAAGGAKEVVTVDLSKTYLDWAQRNFLLNGLALEEVPGRPVYRFIHADVLQYLKTIEPGSFDLIILDPPTFSNSKRMDNILDIQRDHVSLINGCLHALAPGGVLYFSTNFTLFVLDKENIKASEILDYTKRTTPFDFEGRNLRFCYRIT